MSYTLRGVQVMDFSDEPLVITAGGSASGHEFTLEESIAAGIQPTSRQSRASIPLWAWLGAGIATVWYLKGVKRDFAG